MLVAHYSSTTWLGPRCGSNADRRLKVNVVVPDSSAKWAIAAIAAIAIACFGPTPKLLAAEPNQASTLTDLAVTVVKAKRKCFEDTLQVTGVLVPRNEILVRPDQEGLQIKRVLVEPGASVVKDQVLARLERPDGGKKSDDVSVKSPAAGVITSLSATIGVTATSKGQPLFRIAKNGEMELLAETPIDTMTRIAANQFAKVEIIGVGELSGKVRLSSKAINPMTQLGQVHIFVGADRRLRVGAFGRATINVARRCGAAIPFSAVLYGEGGTIVQAVRDNRIETRRVSVGLVWEGEAEIREGISEGDWVVERAGAFVRDGDRVRPMLASKSQNQK